MKGLRPPAPRVPPGARGPSTPRARSLRSPAGLRARARGHAGRDPRPQGPHPPRRSRSLRSLRQAVAAPARRAFVPRPVRRAFCALRVAACAGVPAPARPRFGAARPPPLRGPGPRHCRRRFAPPGPPLGPPAARHRRLRPSAPLSRLPRACGLRGPCRPIRSAVGSLFGRPCFAPGRLWAAVAPGFLSGRPLRGFGGGWLPPGPPRGPSARSSAAVGGPGVGCVSRWCGGVVGFSPAPPRPAAPAGGSGGREARWVASPPASWAALLATLSRAPLALRAGPARDFGPVDFPENCQPGFRPPP